MSYYFLGEELFFPPVEQADEYGILAIGGDLSPARLLLAYRSGIFPWFSQDEPIIWWAPNPRFVLYPEDIKVSKSMKQILRRKQFQITADQHFSEVISHCRHIPRPGQEGTWITPDMQMAYQKLHEEGYAHSIEVWEDGELVGGLYGVSLGRCFFGESMFSRVSNASKAGFISLVLELQSRNFELVDCQVYTQHLASLGAKSIPRARFTQEIQQALDYPSFRGSWQSWFETLL